MSSPGGAGTGTGTGGRTTGGRGAGRRSGPGSRSRGTPGQRIPSTPTPRRSGRMVSSSAPGLDLQTNAEFVESMHAPPETEIRRNDFLHTTAPGTNTALRLYFTPPADGGGPASSPAQQDLVRDTGDALATLANSGNRTAIAALFAWQASLATLTEYPDLILAHENAAELDKDQLVQFAIGFARYSTVLCFEEESDQLDVIVRTARSLLNNYPSVGALGGRSRGARAMVRAQSYTSADKLILFTYPLVDGLAVFEEELLLVNRVTDVLFITGDRDHMATELHLRDLRQRMAAPTWWIRLIGGDHELRFDDGDKRDAMCNIAGQIASMWCTRRDIDRTEMTIEWDERRNRPSFGAWERWQDDDPRPVTRLSVKMKSVGMLGGGGTFDFELP